MGLLLLLALFLFFVVINASLQMAEECRASIAWTSSALGSAAVWGYCVKFCRVCSGPDGDEEEEDTIRDESSGSPLTSTGANTINRRRSSHRIRRPFNATAKIGSKTRNKIDATSMMNGTACDGRTRRRTGSFTSVSAPPSMFLLVVASVCLSSCVCGAFTPISPHFKVQSGSCRPTEALLQQKLQATPSASASATTNAEIKKQRKKSGNKKSKRKQRKKTSAVSGKPRKFLTEQDLADHVSHLYLHGPGGILREDETAVAKRSKPASPQAEFLKKLTHHPALVLNADYQPLSYLPLSLWSWQEAVKAIFSGKVTVVDVYPDIAVRAANLEIAVPSVIALTEYVPLHHTKPAFTKRNVYLRDRYRCQYCDDIFATRDLTLDHVHPRCMGGKLEWENAVTCCRQCNCRKGSMPVSNLPSVGMKLQRPPKTPSQFELAAVAGKMLPRRVHSSWRPYLGLMESEVVGSSSSSSSPSANTASSDSVSSIQQVGEKHDAAVV